MRVLNRCALVAPVLLVANPAWATYSIVAADSASRQVGGAVTSCVAPQSVEIVYRSAPGRGAIHAQAAANTAGRDRGVVLLEAGTAPADVIAQITASSFDSRAQSRQYGVVDLSGRAEGFTGSSNQPYAADRQGTVGSFVYSVQGNILTSARVLAQAESAFRQRGCDLAERLMLALEAGADDGEGDSRCTTASRLPSDSASLQVDREGEAAGSYLRLAFTSPFLAREDPIVRLRALFDTWRTTHPCPAGSDAGTDGGGGMTSGGASGTAGAGGSMGGNAPGGDSGGSVTGGATAGGTAAGGASGAASSGGAVIGSGGSGGAVGSAAGAPAASRATASTDDGGCGCRMRRSVDTWPNLVLAAACLWMARRRARSRALVGRAGRAYVPANVGPGNRPGYLRRQAARTRP